MHYFQRRHQRPEAPSGFWRDGRALWAGIRRVIAQPHRPTRGHKRLYASSLAFKTVLALIPALAIMMAVLADDAFSQKREQLLDQIVDAIYPVQSQAGDSLFDPLEPQNLQKLNEVTKQEIRISVRKFAYHARRVGVIGFLGFLAVVFLLFRDVESSFNFLWGIPRGRRLLPQLFRHAVFFVGVPVLVVVLLTLKGWIGGWHLLQPLLHTWFFSKAVPFAVLWTACAWMYWWIPNAKVDRKSAVLSGLLVALLLEAARLAINWYTFKVLGGSSVYGALWMLPVILIWFYLSWTIVLFGAEVTFSIQRHRENTSA